MTKLRWGVLSTSKFAVEKVIPALKKSEYCEVTAMASRTLSSAKEVTEQLEIPKAYGSYEELLADKDLDVIYNPLPNNLHVAWSIKALEAGKHILCEKPVGLSASEAQELLRASQKFPQLKIMEGFMYRHHPQWRQAKKLVQEGKIGTLRTIQCFFSYHNINPDNIRNIAQAGGGGMFDIGCYCISQARFIFDREPTKVVALLDYDHVLKTDILSSGMLDFDPGHVTFTCSTQLMPYQRVNILGTEGRVEIEIPFNAPLEGPTRMWLHRKDDVEEFSFEGNQYTIQGDLFARSILGNTEVPTPLNDAVSNMRVIDAIFTSVEKNCWVNIS